MPIKIIHPQENLTVIIHTMRLSFVSLVLGLATLTACGPAHYEYPPYSPQSQAYGKSFPMRVAIAYPEEGRSAPDRDEDLEPIITSRCKELPTYISPRMEISRGLLDELRATQSFQTVDWSPESLDDYDLVIRMKFISGGKRFESETCPAMLGPFLWELRILDQRGNEHLRQQLVLAKVKIYAKSPVAEFRKDEGVFLKEAVRQILQTTESMYAGMPDINGTRAITYVEKKDPELKAMRSQITANTDDKQLDRAYLMRIGVLEAERMTADKTTQALQQIYDQAWVDVQEQSRRQLKELGESVNQMLAQNLGLLLDSVNAAYKLNPGVSRPPKILRAISGARGEIMQSVSTPDGTQKLLGTLSKSLLPGHLRKLAADTGFNDELGRQLQTVFQNDSNSSPPPAAEQIIGCNKDTDCKGNRICVKRECVNP